MAQVGVNINGRDYQIACDDGQEEHLSRLGQYVDKRVKELVSAVGQVGDSRLLVMTSLLIADELAETYAALKKAQAAEPAQDAPDGGGPAASAEAEAEDRLAELVEAAAARIEALTERIAAG
ncbi:MAG: cell division protein ZapA [Rhodospirillaceae bacterium]